MTKINDKFEEVLAEHGLIAAIMFAGWHLGKYESELETPSHKSE